MKFQSLFTGKTRLYAVSLATTICLFFLIIISDLALLIRNNYYADTAAILSIGGLYTAIFIFLERFKKKAIIPQLAFFLSASLISFISVKHGYSEGSFFYLFPASVAYINSTANIRNKVRFRHFHIIVFSIAAVAFAYFLFPHNVDISTNEILFKYRSIASFILTAFLITHSLLLKSSHKKTPGKLTYHDALFNSYMDAYIIFDKETLEVTDYNKSLEQILDLPDTVNMRGLYITQVMMRYLSGDSANLEMLMNRIPDDWYGEAKFITHKKTRFDTYLKSSVFVKDDIHYQLLSIRNITEITKAKQELEIYKEKMEKASKAKARFLSSMSHELRTPLNGIIGTSNLVLAENNLPENIKNHINILRYSSEHMLGVINDILDFSKIDAGKLELKKQKFNIRESIDKLTKSFANEFINKDIEFEFCHDPRLGNINVVSDLVKLNQILANLLSNALKFTISGKVILTIKIEDISEKNVTLWFDVKDTGIGIPKEKHAEIFHDFVQVNGVEDLRRFDGTGLGLTISEKIVNIFGGELQVDSEPGKGSSFYFTINFEIAPEINIIKEIKQPSVAPDIRGVRVLIVEDNEINSGILRSFLQRWQIRIKEAQSGIHALELLKYHKFDLILMDLEMPEMDGYTALKKIRETDSNIPVVAFTAALLENMDSLTTEYGFNDYVLKPYNPADLKRKIELYAPHRKIEYA